MRTLQLLLCLCLFIAFPALAQQRLCHYPIENQGAWTYPAIAPGQPFNSGFSTPRVAPWACHEGPSFAPGNISHFFNIAAGCEQPDADEIRHLGNGVFACMDGNFEMWRFTCATLTQDYGRPDIGCPVGYNRIAGNMCESQTAVLEDAAAAALGGAITRNADGNITSYDLGGTNGAYIVNSFDAQKRPTQVTSPDGNMVSFTYFPNSARIQTKTVAAGKTVSYTYDAQGTVATVTSPEGHIYTPQYALDPNRPWGKRLTMIKVNAGVPALSGKPVQCGVPISEQVAELVDKPTLFAKVQTWMEKELSFNAVQPPWAPHTRIVSNGPLLALEWQPPNGDNIELLNPFEPAMSLQPDVCAALSPTLCAALHDRGVQLCWKLRFDINHLPSLPSLWQCLVQRATEYRICLGPNPIPEDLLEEIIQ